MSTHLITDHATIPFPCWLRDYDTGLWRYAINRTAHKSMLIRGWAFSHYSTNPADQRPEDVVPTIAEAASTPEAAENLFKAFYSTATAPDPSAIAREAASEIATAHGAACGSPYERTCLSIITRAIEQATAALRNELATHKNLSAVRDETHEGELRALRVELEDERRYAADMKRLNVLEREETAKAKAENDKLTALRRDRERLIAAAKQAKEALEETRQRLDHNIPHYAYGDNQAAVEMAARIDEADGHVLSAITALSAAMEGQP